MTFPNKPKECDVTQQDIINTLHVYGPLGHKRLAEKLNINWSELTPYMQALRQQGTVVNRIDKRYELTENNDKQHKPVHVP